MWDIFIRWSDTGNVTHIQVVVWDDVTRAMLISKHIDQYRHLVIRYAGRVV